jgi:acyl dehydratase
LRAGGGGASLSRHADEARVPERGAVPQLFENRYRVRAVNTAKASDNKIHDDAVAARYGFKGGLVPGVEVYAYMAHLPVARWGRAWLEHGTAECRLLKPVYDGDIVTVTAEAAGDGVALTLESRGEVCATGRASLPGLPIAAPPAFAEARLPQAPPPAAGRPPASAEALPVGAWLGINPLRVGADEARQYLTDVGETLPLYAKAGLVHPGMLLRIGNWALRDNVALGPWMHVGSRIEHFAAVPIGDELAARALVTGNWEHKGHSFVALDVLVYANVMTPVARIAHTAIYRPRQLAA